MYRPSWDDYFLGITSVVAARADCTRRSVGAVIVKAHRIVATGYNGAPAGHSGCLEGACPRGRHHPAVQSDNVERCRCGHTLPCPSAVAEYSSYDDCISVHAEANALLYADRDRCEGASIYVTDEPCKTCYKLIQGSGIIVIVWPTGKVHYA